MSGYIFICYFLLTYLSKSLQEIYNYCYKAQTLREYCPTLELGLYLTSETGTLTPPVFNFLTWGGQSLGLDASSYI